MIRTLFFALSLSGALVLSSFFLTGCEPTCGYATISFVNESGQTLILNVPGYYNGYLFDGSIKNVEVAAGASIYYEAENSSGTQGTNNSVSVEDCGTLSIALK